MTTNFGEVKEINRLAILREMVNKTTNCALIWHNLSPGQYQTISLPFEFYLTKTNTKEIVDVLVDGEFYASYSSSDYNLVSDLYEIVSSLSLLTNNLSKTQEVVSFVSTLRTCAGVTINITSRGGVVCINKTSVLQIIPSSVLTLLPITLSYGPAFFPWVGTVSDIDDFPNALSSDGDLTYIRQEVVGAAPTNWGYAFVGFNLATINFGKPFKFIIRVSHRRETYDGVNLVITLIINNAVRFTDMVESTSSYQVYTSSLITISDVDSVTQLSVRLNMFTNTGNESPRVLRISAVDLRMSGFTEI